MQRKYRIICVGVAWVCASVVSAGIAFADGWPQFGGPNRDFVIKDSGLADKWPEEGPKRLWHRKLGDSHASVVGDAKVIYTMYRLGEDEFTVALDAATGKTIWECKQASPQGKECDRFGFGPNSTPIIEGDKIYSVGSNSVVHCLDKATGKVIWRQDMSATEKARIMQFGQSASPLIYKNLLIIPIDRQRPHDDTLPAEGETAKTLPKQMLVALDCGTGKIVWKSLDYAIDYASPILGRFEDRDLLIFAARQAIVALDPATGKLLWKMVDEESRRALPSPVWCAPDVLFYSCPNDSVALQMVKEKDGVSFRELWRGREMRALHSNPVLIDAGHAVGSCGGKPMIFACIDLKTGERLWAERGFEKATCVLVGKKLLILDENGKFALATATSKGLTIHSTCVVSGPESFAAPTVIGTKVFIRDRENIMAFDLS